MSTLPKIDTTFNYVFSQMKRKYISYTVSTQPVNQKATKLAKPYNPYMGYKCADFIGPLHIGYKHGKKSRFREKTQVQSFPKLVDTHTHTLVHRFFKQQQ